jgi:ATP-dependent Lhr-like helicase
MAALDRDGALEPLSEPVRAWFSRCFPGGPTPAQALAWPSIARGESILLVAPTGTGKTLAAFLAILDRLLREQDAGRLRPGLRCVYISPLRSLSYDIERNLGTPLEAIRQDRGWDRIPIRVAVRTGDTAPHMRREQRDAPPHLLITTPESLALLLSQPAWNDAFRSVETVIVDEIHALVPTKRGADLAVSIERLAALAPHAPSRVGLSATCRPAAPVARFLVGPNRACRIVEAPDPPGYRPPSIEVETLLGRDEAPHRALTYRRLIRRLRAEIARHRTTVVFANTRSLTEKITHDLRRTAGLSESVAAHHSSLDAARRREVEAALKSGELRAVITSTSLELGVDIGTADQTVLIGLPGSASRCLQRIGRSGHNIREQTRGILLAATPAELAGAAVTASAARERRIEPLRAIANPLDVLCQQLLGMACAGERSADEAFELVRKSAPFEDLERADFDDCLAFLAGDLAAPAGAYEPEPGANPRWTSPRIWRSRGLFGVRSRRVVRWLRSNIGTITSEESLAVIVEDRLLGTLEGAYAERLQPGDRFVLDGRALEFRRTEGRALHARSASGDPELPRWSSDRQSLSAELARDLAQFRDEAARLHTFEGPAALRAWLADRHELETDAADVLGDLFAAQAALSEVPAAGTVLIEESPHPEGFDYAFHTPLGRDACEALGRATGARLGRQFGRNVVLVVSDLGWSLRLTGELRLGAEDLPGLVDPENFEADVLVGLDRGELLARRFRHVAATALMVLRNPDGPRVRVGGLNWVSQRLYPLVAQACPNHPLLRETRREVLDELLDAPGALAWLRERPLIRFRSLEAPSPFTAAWIDAGGLDPLRFEPPVEALRRLHARLAISHE